ncbi:MAG: hypothetical protein IKZ04_00205 [Spirochaetaceae bacterium]|nr:hypothetical protein [Spirochaetaceae bacterium]
MKIYGIGRAMVDYYMNSEPLGFNPGGSIHIDGITFDKLISTSNKENLIRQSGGSCCNTLKVLSHMGHSVVFSGTTGDSDIFGEADFFSENLAASGITFLNHTEKGKTGRCFISKTNGKSSVIAASPETASKITKVQIDMKILSAADWCIAEGMELDNKDIWETLSEKIVQSNISTAILCGTKFGAEKTADFLCNLDSYPKLSKCIKLIFANNIEASILKDKGIDFIEYSQKEGFIFVITNEDKGSSAFINGKEIFEKAIISETDFCETTGAGDVFAGAFLSSFINSNGTDIKSCLKNGNKFASRSLSVPLCNTKELFTSHNSTGN